MLRRRLGLCRGPTGRSRGGGKRARGSADDHASDFRDGGIGNGLRLRSDAPGTRPRHSLFTPMALPTWLRWLTLIAAIAAFAGLAYFPLILVLLWGVIVGLWLLIAHTERRTGRA